MCIDSSNVSFNIAYMDILVQNLPDEVLGVVLGYSGKGFVCDEWELYLHHAFNFMTQYTKELCKRLYLGYDFVTKFHSIWCNVCSTWAEDWKYGWEVCRSVVELENLKKAMKFIMDANDNDPFIRFRVGRKSSGFVLNSKTPEDYEISTQVFIN